MTDPRPIRVLVVDDHALFRAAIAALLQTNPAFVVAGEAGTGLEALQQALALAPDVILMDLAMPEMDGLEATRRIKAALPDTRIVMLTMTEADAMLFAAIQSGAQGYLVKEIDPDAFFRTLTVVARGESGLSHALTAKLMAEVARHPQPLAAAPADPAGCLTLREHEVLQLVAQGKSNREIAELLGIAHTTVKTHVRGILEKLHLENRVQAVAYALRTARSTSHEEPR
jgi:DNA-binding NarL/FixJ family response regulator